MFHSAGNEGQKRDESVSGLMLMLMGSGRGVALCSAWGGRDLRVALQVLPAQPRLLFIVRLLLLVGHGLPPGA
ncbi:hypothetical protein INR49_016800 [Caranx melampygus]|nr:hypothetical protein INR49_016800 [Caranx melampygus]